MAATHAEVADAETIAAQLGEFLSALHALDADELSRVELHAGKQTPNAYWPNVELELASLETRLGGRHIEECRAFLRRQESDFGVAKSRVLLHADLRDEHILLAPDGSHVVGIIDWTDASRGDAAHDFAGIWEWQGEDFALCVRAFYAPTTDDGFWARVRFYGLCSTITTLDYTFKIGDERLAAAASRGLERALD